MKQAHAFRRKGTLILFALVTITQYTWSQEYINIQKPFKNEKPDAVWKAGNYLEIVYELDRKEFANTADVNYLPVTEIVALELVGEITIRSKSYPISIPGSSLMGGKFRFVIFGPLLDPTQNITITQTNYQSVDYYLKYKIGDANAHTQIRAVINNAYVGNEGNISIDRVTYNVSNSNFTVDVKSSHDLLDFRRTDILTYDPAARISVFQSQSTSGKASDGTYRFSITLSPIDGLDIIKLANANSNKVHVKIVAASTDNPNFAEASGSIPLSFGDNLIVAEISNKESYGLNRMQLKVTTNLPATSLKMVFIENPYVDGQITEIPGTKLNSNNFQFDVPTDKEAFRPGKYKVKFVGKDYLGNGIKDDTYEIEKKSVETQLTTVVQDNYMCDFGVRFKQTSPGPVQLVFLKTRNTKSFSENDGTFVARLNLQDDEIRQNLERVGTDDYLRVSINAFGEEYNPLGIKVILLDKEQAKRDLEQIEGNRTEKRNKIRQYLEEHKFAGNMEEMTTAIFTELSKKNNQRDWSQTWQTVGKFLRPAAGLLMLLV